MGIFNWAKNIIEKPYTKRKLKSELDKFDQTIKQMVVYESINNYVRSIVNYAKIEDSYDFLIGVLTRDNIDSEQIKKYAISQGHENLVKLLPKNGIELSADETILAKKMLAAECKRPEIDKISNIAFSGGGAKGIAHVGTLRIIDELNLKIEAVSGTSAGAIAALPFALGYKPSKIAEIVTNYDFTSFLQESTLHDSFIGNLVTKLSSSKRALMYRTVYFDSFVRDMEKPLSIYILSLGLDKTILNLEYPDETSEKDKIRMIMEKLKSQDFNLEQRRLLSGSVMNVDLSLIVKNAEKNAGVAFINEIEKNEKKLKPSELQEKLSLGFKSPSEALKTFFRINRKEDVIEEFFGDLIENKIKIIDKEILNKVYQGFSKPENIRNMTFKEFEKLRELCPNNDFKNIGICICQKISDNPLNVFNKDNYHQIDVHSQNENKEYSNMPIKTAVRISMNLPGAFSSYKYKDKKYVDGGVRANFPLHFFDKTLNVERSRTLGFALAPEDNYTRTSDVNNIGAPESPVELFEPSIFKRAFKKLLNGIGHYYSHKIYGQKLDNNNPMDQMDFLRVGFINVLKVGTNDFNLSKSTKQKLMQQGYSTSKKLLENDYEAQINHYRERVRAINKKIKKLKGKSVVKLDFVDELREMNYSNMVEHENNPKIQSIIKGYSNESKQKFTKRVKRG